MPTTMNIELLQKFDREEIDEDEQKEWNGVDDRNVKPDMNDFTI